MRERERVGGGWGARSRMVGGSWVPPLLLWMVVVVKVESGDMVEMGLERTLLQVSWMGSLTGEREEDIEVQRP